MVGGWGVEALVASGERRVAGGLLAEREEEVGWGNQIAGQMIAI